MVLNPNPTVVITKRRVTLLNPPYINPTNNLLWTTGKDNRGFQYQIALDVLPPGVTSDMIQQGQTWFIENMSTAYRLSLYVGQISVSTINGVTVSGTPVAGNSLVATSPTTASWTSSNINDTGWVSVTSFSNSFSATNAVAYRLLNGVVYLRGSLTGGTAGATAFTLPSNCRPSAGMTFATQQYGSSGDTYITVTTGGAVQPNTSAAWLTGVIFPNT